MVQIIEEGPSFSKQFARASGQNFGSLIAGGLEGYVGKAQREKENSFFKSTFGIDLAGASPEARQEFTKQFSKAMAQEKLLKHFGIGPQEQRTENGERLSSSPEISSAQKPESSVLSNMTPEQRIVAEAIVPGMGKMAQGEETIKQKKFEADRKYHSQRSAPFLNKITNLGEGLRERRTAINSSMAAVQSGQMSPLGGDFWADILHAPQLKSASGAQLETAAKINLMGALSGLTGGRLNQFIEKQIDNAFAKAGNTKEAQMAKLLMAKTVMDLDQDYVDISNRIADEDREKYGYVRENIDNRAQKEMKSLSKERMSELSFELQQNIENDIGQSNLYKNATKPVMKGTYLTPEMANILADKIELTGEPKSKENILKLARNLGYEIPSNDLLEKMGYIRE